MSAIIRTLLITLLIIAALVGGVFLSLMLNPQQDKDELSKTIPGLMWPNPKQLVDFELTDQNGQPFTLENFKDQWSILFFGYTRCPDICPATMGMMNNIVKKIEESQKAAPRIVFVSVDPERDNQEMLKDYMAYFNPDFIGLTGDNASLAAFQKQLGILSMKINQEESGEYLMDHTASIILIGPNADLLSIYSAPHDADRIREHYLTVRGFLEDTEE